jgi:hypothetical protein
VPRAAVHSPPGPPIQRLTFPVMITATVAA